MLVNSKYAHLILLISIQHLIKFIPMMQWPCNDHCKAASVVLVEHSALSRVADIHIAGEDAGDLRHRAIVPHSVLDHAA